MFSLTIQPVDADDPPGVLLLVGAGVEAGMSGVVLLGTARHKSVSIMPLSESCLIFSR